MSCFPPPNVPALSSINPRAGERGSDVCVGEVSIERLSYMQAQVPLQLWLCRCSAGLGVHHFAALAACYNRVPKTGLGWVSAWKRGDVIGRWNGLVFLGIVGVVGCWGYVSADGGWLWDG